MVLNCHQPCRSMRIVSLLQSRLTSLHRLPARAYTMSASHSLQGRVVKGVVFDMDGTLTKPVIDFAEMRQRVGVPPGMDILDYLHSLSEEEKARATAAIADIEEQALENMQIMPGALELCRVLDDKGLPRALVTRNVTRSVDFFHKTHFTLPPFVPALSREFMPYKPHPASLQHIASHWGIQPSELMMIGDSAKDDVVCGRRAGAVTVLLDTLGHYSHPDELEGEQRPDFHVTCLDQITHLLTEVLVPQPPPREPEPLAESADAAV